MCYNILRKWSEDFSQGIDFRYGEFMMQPTMGLSKQTKKYFKGIVELRGLMVPFFVVFLLFTCFSQIAEAGAVGQNRVLFINSYSRDYLTVPVVVNNVEKELKDIATIQYIFMENKDGSILLVQFHPEELQDSVPETRSLFKHLVEQASAHKK